MSAWIGSNEKTRIDHNNDLDGRGEGVIENRKDKQLVPCFSV